MAYKMVTLLRKRDDLSLEQFRRDYEGRHALLGRRVLQGRAIRYERRYIEPFLPDETGSADHHVLLEVWYADKAACEAGMAWLTSDAVAQEIAEDEERIFDRSATRFYVVADEIETPGIADPA